MNLSGGMLEESSQRKITSEFLHLFELYYNHQVLATKWGFFLCSYIYWQRFVVMPKEVNYISMMYTYNS